MGFNGMARVQVRDDFKHMQRYRDISIAQMSADFEKVREHLQISQWLIFGGSWGSTLGLDYAQRYASVCLGLIIRGIYLNSKPEFDAIYSRSPFLADARRLAEFDTWQELAVAEAKQNGEPEL
jgi:pimeloyl-ACP methyl ester carboxylesterase